ncbi:hypothetical protein ACRCJU_09530 [Aerococcus urinaeequi]|uniref:hypothetical protein n=1 Tax=Aerococcus urinaeequi TaxID=51665 RepID=UPI003D6B23E8
MMKSMNRKDFTTDQSKQPPRKVVEKDVGKAVRIPTVYYDILREKAFKENTTIKSLLEDILDKSEISKHK